MKEQMITYTTTTNNNNKKDIEKIAETKPVNRTWHFPSCDKTSVVIRHENNRVF